MYSVIIVTFIYFTFFLSFVSPLRLKKYLTAKLNGLNMSYRCIKLPNTNNINHQHYIFEHFIKHVRYLIMNFSFGRYFM